MGLGWAPANLRMQSPPMSAICRRLSGGSVAQRIDYTCRSDDFPEGAGSGEKAVVAMEFRSRVGAGHIRGLGFAIARSKSRETRNKKRRTVAVLIGRREAEVHNTGSSDTLGGTTGKRRMGSPDRRREERTGSVRTERGSLFCSGVEYEIAYDGAGACDAGS